MSSRRGLFVALCVVLCATSAFGIDFSQWKTCGDCTAAGYGWCPNLRKCGGFANKNCGEGERYQTVDYTGPGAIKAAPVADTAVPKKSPTAAMDLVPGNFDKAAMDKNKHALIMFYAPWCGHCKKMHPDFDQTAAAFYEEDSVIVAKVDADAHGRVGSPYGVSGFPTLVYLPAGDKSKHEKYTGGRDAESMVAFLNDKAGLMRNADGSVTKFSFTDTFTKLVKSYAAGDKDGAIAAADNALESVPEGPERNIAKAYPVAMKKMVKGGTAYLAGEVARLEHLRAQNNTPLPKKKEFAGKIDILRSIQELLGMKAAAGGAEDADLEDDDDDEDEKEEL